MTRISSSTTEKPLWQRPRRLADWLNPDGQRKVHSLVDKVYQSKNLRGAWEKVKANRGSGGIDGQSLEEFEQGLEEHLGRLHEELRTDRYQPRPVRRGVIPKAGKPGEGRPLGIPTITAYCGVVQYAFRVPHRDAPVPPVGGPAVTDPFRASSSDRSQLYL
jgi:RNA-directed DNA polymerase